MNWGLLKNELCPTCKYPLVVKDVFYLCGACGFTIRKGKAYEIVGKPKTLHKIANLYIKKHQRKYGN